MIVVSLPIALVILAVIVVGTMVRGRAERAGEKARRAEFQRRAQRRSPTNTDGSDAD
jgi:hypothetical protein